MNRFVSLILFLILVLGGGLVLGGLTVPGGWYAGLNKPSFNPGAATPATRIGLRLLGLAPRLGAAFNAGKQRGAA